MLQLVKCIGCSRLVLAPSLHRLAIHVLHASREKLHGKAPSLPGVIDLPSCLFSLFIFNQSIDIVGFCWNHHHQLVGCKYLIIVVYFQQCPIWNDDPQFLSHSVSDGWSTSQPLAGRRSQARSDPIRPKCQWARFAPHRRRGPYCVKESMDEHVVDPSHNWLVVWNMNFICPDKIFGGICGIMFAGSKYSCSRW